MSQCVFNTKKENQIISAIKCPQNKRKAFFQRFLGSQFNTRFIGDFIQTQKEMFEQPFVGSWNYYELSNGGFYVAPISSEVIAVYNNRNNKHALLSPDAAGVVVTLRTLCDDFYEFTDMYHSLLPFAEQHDEAKSIDWFLSLLD